MILIASPNSWSCTLAAAAMAFDIDIENLIKMIGHDGSEIIHPELPDPGRRKGFCMPEIVEVAEQLDIWMTPIVNAPVQTPDGKHTYPVVDLGQFRTLEDRLEYYVRKHTGLILGQAKSGWWHTCAVDKGKIYDPRMDTYDYNDCKIDIDEFWITR